MLRNGVLVGCDAFQEWLLPWWWEHYSMHNPYEVAFADFGMSCKAKKWCRIRGEFISIPQNSLHVANRDVIDPHLLEQWEQLPSPFWDSRHAWFKKPFALLNSPFDQTLWLDLDCEVKGCLEPLFRYIHPESKIGLVRVREAGEIAPYAIYNSGVIAFEKSELIEEWAELALSKSDLYLGDQDALSDLIFQKKIEIGEMPIQYNWQMCRGIPLNALILHWSADWGKKHLKMTLNL